MKGPRTSTKFQTLGRHPTHGRAPGRGGIGDLARLRVKTEASVLTLGSGNLSHSLGGWNATTLRRFTQASWVKSQCNNNKVNRVYEKRLHSMQLIITGAPDANMFYCVKNMLLQCMTLDAHYHIIAKGRYPT
jgi:hypothetical protein